MKRCFPSQFCDDGDVDDDVDGDDVDDDVDDDDVDDDVTWNRNSSFRIGRISIKLREKFPFKL